MLGRLTWLRRLLLDLPRHAKLAYCLATDPRVPVRNKAALGAAMALIVTPIVDVPLWIPVIGEMDAVALSLLATQLFVAAAPGPVVREQERLIAEGRSRFDLDVAEGRRLATLLARRLARDTAEVADDSDLIEVAQQPVSATVDRPAGGVVA